MPHELIVEASRLSREVSRHMQNATVSSEIPLRLHSRDTDGGGSPEFHHEFIRWLGPICDCGRAAVCAPGCNAKRYDEHFAECEPACRIDTRFHPSTFHSSPTRMRRALRQVRRLNPKAYDFLYLVVALHYSFEQAAAKINLDNLSRGKPEQSAADFAVLWVSGASMLATGF